MLNLALVAVPMVALGGWYLTKHRQYRRSRGLHSRLNKDYLAGLNYLLNEQPDKAVDVFVKMLEVDSDTVETHLALGNLFRRRGEVDRAIRIHQNLIARPNLAKSHRVHALLALGQDYLKAGVLDRAEKLFLEVVESGEYTAESYQHLIDVYQQERDWHEAIQMARRFEMASGQHMQKNIAHYYCELAQEARLKVSREQAFRYLKKAQAADRYCARSYLLQGEWEANSGNYKQAIKAYKRVIELQPELIPEVAMLLVRSYESLGWQRDLISYLYQTLSHHPTISVIMLLSERIQKMQGAEAAIDFIVMQLRAHPTIKGLQRLIEIQLSLAQGEEKQPLSLLTDITHLMLEKKPKYRCEHCGYAGKVLHWLCPSCKFWNTTFPIHGLEGE